MRIFNIDGSTNSIIEPLIKVLLFEELIISISTPIITGISSTADKLV